MEGVKEQSGILTWSIENIESVPPVCGVAVLRFSPINGDILSILPSENLYAVVSTKFLETEASKDVKFFEWYTTDTAEASEKLSQYLLDRHGAHMREEHSEEE